MKLVPDLLEAKHWLYPLNQPKRDYQFNIVRHCLFANTLVALPTGLGKTFIAGSVMLNCMCNWPVLRYIFLKWVSTDYRWFPKGKVVFVAPTRPLVTQQIHACHKVCGIPGTDAVELTGAVQKHVRAKYVREFVFTGAVPVLIRLLVGGEACVLYDTADPQK
jgi:ATP-dependent DNA helicase MPH1